MKKRQYIIPRTAIINAGMENFILGSLHPNGDGTWSQTTSPEDDPDEDEARAKYGFWDL